MIEYSVIIRTTGKAGEKYQRLLDSIAALQPQPKEVLVVLPHGFDLPPERLGWETFCFCEKGILNQRQYGTMQCKTQYALFCDDDVCFGKDFVSKLYQPIADGIASISAGPLTEFFPNKGAASLFYMLTGAAIPRRNSNGKYVTILATTGYTYYRNIDTSKTAYLETESLPGTCYFGDVEQIRKIHMEDELWLEKNGFATMEDQTFFYKATLSGIKTVVVTDALYAHLDGRTSWNVSAKNSYALEFNRYVFWYRFIYSKRKNAAKLWAKICIEYYFGVKRLYNLWRLFKGRLSKEAYDVKSKAVRDAKHFVKEM